MWKYIFIDPVKKKICLIFKKCQQPLYQHIFLLTVQKCLMLIYIYVYMIVCVEIDFYPANKLKIFFLSKSHLCSSHRNYLYISSVFITQKLPYTLLLFASIQNEKNCHDITEILLKVALSIINKTNKQTKWKKIATQYIYLRLLNRKRCRFWSNKKSLHIFGQIICYKAVLYVSDKMISITDYTHSTRALVEAIVYTYIYSLTSFKFIVVIKGIFFSCFHYETFEGCGSNSYVHVYLYRV
jgi:hypothetical protein